MKRKTLIIILAALVVIAAVLAIVVAKNQPSKSVSEVIIMQGGKVRANVTKSEIDGKNITLEDLFFEVTEGIEKEDVSMSEDSESAEAKEGSAE